jgi:ketopantoate reductase
MSQLAVIGAGGRIGHLVCGMRAPGLVIHPVTRAHDPVGLDRPGPAMPLLVCTRNDDLPAVLDRVHSSRRPDLVFVQNGMLRPWLEDHGLGENPRGVLWVAVPKKGDPPVPGGESPFVGRHAALLADLLQRNGVDAAAVNASTFAREEAVKLAWICVYGPLGSATGAKVGVLADQHRADARALSDELHPLLQHQPGLDLDPAALFDRLQDYSARIPHFSAAVKEWRWRNGWQLALAQSRGVQQPALLRWLHRAGIDPETGP